MKRKGLRENRICRALYSYTDKNGVAQMLLTSHVDDLLWACDPSCDWIVKELIDEFKCGTVESGSFKYCGKEIAQDEDFTIHVSCADATRAIKKIPTAPRRRPGDPLMDSDKTQLKSVAGSLAWVSRQRRPDLAYRVSKILPRHSIAGHLRSVGQGGSGVQAELLLEDLHQVGRSRHESGELSHGIDARFKQGALAGILDAAVR